MQTLHDRKRNILGLSFFYHCFKLDLRQSESFERHLLMGIKGYIFALTKLKVTQTTFLLKCKNLPKCIKFCSTRKLEVAAKNFGL